MKKTVLLPLALISLLLGGCTTTSKKKTSKGGVTSEGVSSKENASSSVINPSSNQDVTSQVSPSSGGGTSLNPTSQNGGTSSAIPPTSSQTPSTSQTPPTGEIIEGVFILDPSIEAKVGVRTKTPNVEIFYTDGHSIDDFDENPLTWDTSDHSIAVSDEYGRVTAYSKGIVTLTCHSIVDNKSASVVVYCYNNESDFEKSWKRMEPTDVLTPGDQLIIACPQYNKAATDNCTGMQLHSCDVTFNSDKSVMTETNLAAKFILGTDYKGRDGYNLEIPEREDGCYLACTNEKKVSFFDTPKASSNLWEIEYNNAQNCWDMRSATTIDGWMMYNRDLDRFAPYESNETEFMVVMTLYRLTRTFK